MLPNGQKPPHHHESYEPTPQELIEMELENEKFMDDEDLFFKEHMQQLGGGRAGQQSQNGHNGHQRSSNYVRGHGNGPGLGSGPGPGHGPGSVHGLGPGQISNHGHLNQQHQNQHQNLNFNQNHGNQVSQGRSYQDNPLSSNPLSGSTSGNNWNNDRQQNGYMPNSQSMPVMNGYQGQYQDRNLGIWVVGRKK